MDEKKVDGYAEIASLGYGRLIEHIAASIVEDCDGDRVEAACAVDGRRHFASKDTAPFLDDILGCILDRS